VLIEAGASASQAGTHRDELLSELSGAQQALAAGDAQTAVRHFSAMQQTLLAGHTMARSMLPLWSRRSSAYKRSLRLAA